MEQGQTQEISRQITLEEMIEECEKEQSNNK